MKAFAFLILSLAVLGSAAEDVTVEAGEAVEVASSSTGASRSAATPPPANAEKQEFQTDVRKMLDIIINSLYTNRNIFLRELISNAADALDKIRFLYLTNPKDPRTPTGESPNLDIRIIIDRDAHTLTLRDGGIGMTKEDLRNHLGKIGASGTKQFLEKAQAAHGDAKLIGQFGVGFYSAFLVADRVVVASKNDDNEQQWIWDSTADGEYTLYEDPRGNTLGRGTEVTLYLKEDADEFLDAAKIKEVAARYSEFVHFPILLARDVDVTTTKGDDAAAEDVEADEVKDIEEAAKDQIERKTRTEWDRLNENQPVWTRKPSDVTDSEYKNFYKALSKTGEEPLLWDHFSAEGEVEFKSILFIPQTSPSRLWEAAKESVSNVKLYVRRVFITDDFQDLLPRYLSFIHGVVDSDDLPLNVGRELLQESRVLKIIKKKLVRKVLSMIKDAADGDVRALEDYEKAKKEAAEDDAKVDAPNLKFTSIWQEYGRALRLGLIDDAPNRQRIAKLLRYKSTKALKKDEWRSLEQYVEDMIPGQNEIYYVIGLEGTPAELAKKPALAKFKKVGAEVLIMTDPIDEYVVGHMPDFSGKKLTNLAREDVKVPGEDSDEAKKLLARRVKENQDFLDWFKDILGKKVEKVVLSTRLVDAPALVASSKYGMTANMHLIMKGTPLGDQQTHQSLQKIFELNINHPVVRALRDQSRVDADSSTLKESATLLYESALFESGFALDNQESFVTRMQANIGKALGVEKMEVLPEEELPAEEIAEDEETIDADAESDEPASGTSADEL